MHSLFWACSSGGTLPEAAAFMRPSLQPLSRRSRAPGRSPSLWWSSPSRASATFGAHWVDMLACPGATTTAPLSRTVLSALGSGDPRGSRRVQKRSVPEAGRASSRLQKSRCFVLVVSQPKPVSQRAHSSTV